MMEDQEKGAGFLQEQLKSLEAIVQSVVERSLKEHGSAAGAEPRDTPTTSGTGSASGRPARKGGLGERGCDHARWRVGQKACILGGVAGHQTPPPSGRVKGRRGGEPGFPAQQRNSSSVV